jgi:sucrose-6-phosphate hydrolase SacC (GH32 family)
VGIDILLDAAAGEWTRVGYDLDSGVLFVDQSHTNAHNPALSDAYQTTAPLQTVTGSATSTLNITVLVDGGLVESYANDHVVISSLLSPSTNGSIAAEMRSVRAVSTGRSAGGGDTVTSTASCTATAWKMRSIGN